VELAFDMTAHSVIGLWEAVRHYAKFKRLLDQLVEAARTRQPAAVIGIDFSGFNRRFSHAVKLAATGAWRPRLIQFVSPQVWASRPGRAQAMAQDYDLLLSIFPFELDWYRQHAPSLHVEFVGHPIFDRFPRTPGASAVTPASPPMVLLLPGSRVSELKRHLPPMLGACRIIQGRLPPTQAVMVLPNEDLRLLAKTMGVDESVRMQIGGLSGMLEQASLGIASTGTVTVECAYFGVPTVTLYKTSWSTYQIGKRIVKVKSLTMPNILAGEMVYPEFIQDAATAENLAGAALEILQNPARAEAMRARLRQVIATLGGPGACARGAKSVWEVIMG
jgi:lipid-A-disaccharide synthase